jgi:hypothetical protein
VKAFKKPGSLTIIKRTDVQNGSVWFVEDSNYIKVAGPFSTETEAIAGRETYEQERIAARRHQEGIVLSLIFMLLPLAGVHLGALR